MSLGLGVVGDADAARGTLVPVSGSEGLLGTLPVMGEKGGLLVEVVGFELFDGPCDGAVGADASLRQLRVIGDRLGVRSGWRGVGACRSSAQEIGL